MPDAEVAGYAKYTVNLGSATQLDAVFNNGSGTWDNNGGLNYFFPAGTQTFNTGTITAGAPSADTTAPSVPTGLAAPSKTSTSVSLAWTASTDASGIAGYDVYRDGSLVGSPTSASYTDSGLTLGTAYSYTVRARDTAGNASAQSTALSVTTSTSGATITWSARTLGARHQPRLHHARQRRRHPHRHLEVTGSGHTPGGRPTLLPPGPYKGGRITSIPYIQCESNSRRRRNPRKVLGHPLSE
jgi:hypothetical protein